MRTFTPVLKDNFALRCNEGGRGRSRTPNQRVKTWNILQESKDVEVERWYRVFGCIDANGELRSASWERWVDGEIDSIKDDDNPTRKMDDVVFKYKRCCVI